MQTNIEARPVTVAEACAVLALDQEQAQLLMCGPFAPVAGRLDLRQVLGCAVVRALPMLDAVHAVQIALSASVQAQTGAPARLLAVGWNHDGPVGCWLSGPLPSDILHPMLALPADRMLAELTARMSEHRASAARPN
jgi:hypothetical protein